MHDDEKNTVEDAQFEVASENVGDENESAIDQALQDDASEQPAVEQPVQKSSDEQVLEAQQEVLRVRAEMENFRKRMQREAENTLKYANMNLVRDMLEAVDNLKRAADAAKEENASASALRDGVEMVASQIQGVLDKHGCKLIEALGCEFDPNFHEAIGQTPSEEYASGFVAQEVTVGYRLHDRVVRPSCVLVSTGPAEAAQ